MDNAEILVFSSQILNYSSIFKHLITLSPKFSSNI